jgi:hypothetical protein
MKIDYNILWVEDDKSWYDTTLELFKGTLEEKGFELKSDRKTNFQQLNDLIQKDGLQKYDMLLIDFTLPNSSNGDEIIKLIRNSDIYTDILFYSSAVEKVRDSIRERGLEGVYTADKKEIETKFNFIFSTTIKKIQEVNSMRGLIMGETSELDVEIENAYNIIIELLTEDELKPKINKIFSDDYKEIKKNNIKNCKTKRDTHLTDYKTYFSESDAFRKWKLLKELLKIKSFDGFNLELFKKYSADIIEIRNRFAHVKTEEKDGKMFLRGHIGKEPLEYDETKCIEIRQKLIAHRNNINVLNNILKTSKI